MTNRVLDSFGVYDAMRKIKAGGEPYFYKCDFSDVYIKDVSFTNVDFKNCIGELVCFNCNFVNCKFAECMLNVSSFTKCLFKNNMISSSSFRRSKFTQSIILDSKIIDSDFYKCDLSTCKIDNTKIADTPAFKSKCPDSGSFIGWKRLTGFAVAKILIPGDAERSSGTTELCKCSKALVLGIYNYNGVLLDKTVGTSLQDEKTKYTVGETVYADYFEKNRFSEISPREEQGIYFFASFDEATNY